MILEITLKLSQDWVTLGNPAPPLATPLGLYSKTVSIKRKLKF